MVVGQDVAGRSVHFHDDARAGALLLIAPVVVARPEAFGQIGFAVAVAIGEESPEHVIGNRKRSADAFDGLVHFDLHDRRLDRFADVAENGGEVFGLGKLLARGLDLRFGPGELRVADDAGAEHVSGPADRGEEQDAEGLLEGLHSCDSVMVVTSILGDRYVKEFTRSEKVAPFGVYGVADFAGKADLPSFSANCIRSGSGIS